MGHRGGPGAAGATAGGGALLVLGTCRPVELIVHQHPLKTIKQELTAHGQCVELPLGYLPRRRSPPIWPSTCRPGEPGRRGRAGVSAHRGPSFVHGAGRRLSAPAGPPGARGAAAAHQAIDQAIPQGLQQIAGGATGALRGRGAPGVEVGVWPAPSSWWPVWRRACRWRQR